jgi:hypothetical protein
VAHIGVTHAYFTTKIGQLFGGDGHHSDLCAITGVQILGDKT